MIGNAHIDPVWLWQWPEGYQEVRATFRVGARPHGRVPGLRLHLRLGALLRLGRGARPAAVRADPRADRRRPLAGHRRLVDRARLQHPARRVVRPARALRPALPARPLRHHRDDRRELRLVRAQRDDPAAPPQERHGLVRVPAARAARAPAAGPDLLVGVARRLARARLPDPARVLQRRAATSATTSTSRWRSCRRTSRS